MTKITTRREPSLAYVSDSGIVPFDPGFRITFDVPAWERKVTTTSTFPQHGHNPSAHAISDGHTMQRIAGIPLSWVTPQPAADLRGYRVKTTTPFYTDGPLIPDDGLEERETSPQQFIPANINLASRLRNYLDKQPRPYTRTAWEQENRLRACGTAHSITADVEPAFTERRTAAESVLGNGDDPAYMLSGAQLEEKNTYDGFVENDTPAPNHSTSYSRDVAKIRSGEDATLEDLTELFLRTADAHVQRAMPAGTSWNRPSHNPMRRSTPQPFHVPLVTSHEVIDAWEWKRVTVVDGWKPCTRCDIHTSWACNYCQRNGGWPITRDITAPVHPDLGCMPRGPRKPGQSYFDGTHSPRYHSRTYLGDCRRKRPARGAKGSWSAKHREEIRYRLQQKWHGQLAAIAAREQRMLQAA